jgi:hypothetical protein
MGQTQAQHTPGPWTAYCQNNTAAIRDKDGVLLASASVRDIETPECQANARLIAAAPELLEVCKHVLLECPGIWNTCQSTWETFGAMLDAAISKAEGRA